MYVDAERNNGKQVDSRKSQDGVVDESQVVKVVVVGDLKTNKRWLMRVEFGTYSASQRESVKSWWWQQ